MARTLLFVLVFSLGLVVGCKKQQSAGALTNGAGGRGQGQAGEKLPGASGIRDALKQKDYSKAVAGLLALQGTVAGDEQWTEYRQLNSEVGQALAAAAPTDSNAAQALAAYRAAVYGR